MRIAAVPALAIFHMAGVRRPEPLAVLEQLERAGRSPVLVGPDNIREGDFEREYGDIGRSSIPSDL